MSGSPARGGKERSEKSSNDLRRALKKTKKGYACHLGKFKVAGINSRKPKEISKEFLLVTVCILVKKKTIFEKQS